MAYPLSNTIGQNRTSFDGILRRDQIFVAGLNTTGKYHGKYPWYLDYHGAENVCAFHSL